MTLYTVVWKYELIQADSPREAAELAALVLDDAPTTDWEYEVINDDTGEITKVDLCVFEFDNEDSELEALTGVRMCLDD
jgi:hypothetical protein